MKLQLPLQWGDGTRLAGDGSLWVLSRHSPFGERHIRYGRWGGIAYYHVADNYIAIFSKFIPCGVYEAVHILDPLIKKLVEIKGKIIHGDTHAQSASVYGLAFLLGIKLMPRIRNWKDLKFYKSNMETKFQNTFIPKTTLDTPSITPQRSTSFFTFIAMIVFLLSCVLAGGVFLWNQSGSKRKRAMD